MCTGQYNVHLPDIHEEARKTGLYINKQTYNSFNYYICIALLVTLGTSLGPHTFLQLHQLCHASDQFCGSESSRIRTCLCRTGSILNCKRSKIIFKNIFCLSNKIVHDARPIQHFWFSTLTSNQKVLVSSKILGAGSVKNDKDPQPCI